MTPLIPLAALVIAASSNQNDEEAFYTADYLTPPDGAVLEVGGMDFLPDGRLAISTRRGQVWLVENPLAENPDDARFSLFAEGLWEGLGLRVLDGEIHVVQRGEISRLRDVDRDGVCDSIDTICSEWGLSGNYHEFAYGLPVDERGNFYVTLNVSFFSPKWWLGQSKVPYRGWTLKISPDGELSPFACGFRSPCGVALSPDGRLFVTDNQGDWMPASPVFLVEEGGFYGHPVSLNWTPEYLAAQTLASDTTPPARAANDRTPPALWLPYKWSRSPGNLAWDETDGRFGPFGGQVFISELTNGMVLRGDFEEIDGVTQGWVLPFRRGVGSVVRVAFAPDGTLMCGFTNRGWGGLAPADGVGRIRWTGTTPFEIEDVRLHSSGFTVRFTKPPARRWLESEQGAASRVHAIQYDYDYWWEYGSPERETTELHASEITLSGNELDLSFEDLRPGRMARLRFVDLTSESGEPLLHDEFAYTVNVLPGVPRADPIARIVPPPPARESGEEGWLRLTYGDATHGWKQEGWELVAAELDPDDPTRFRVSKGDSHLTNTASETPSDYVSRAEFGDAKIHLDFTLPEDGRSSVFVMGAYGIRLADGELTDERAPEECGALLAGAGFEARAPLNYAYRGAGERHGLDIEFEAPRFDAEGNKVANARFVRILSNDVLLHENVELPGPSRGAPRQTEAAAGPLVIAGGPTQVAIGDIRVRPRSATSKEAAELDRSWTPLIDFAADDPLAGWTITDDGYWYVEDDTLIGEGPPSRLVSPTSYENFQLRAELKISDGGNSGVFLRATRADTGDFEGYEAEVNSSFAAPNKSGSLNGFADVPTHLIAPDTWFEYSIRCTDDPRGTLVELSLNGVVVNEVLDTERTYERGHIVLEQHHDGSVVEFRKLEIREL